MADTDKIKLPGNGTTPLRIDQREQDTTIIDGVPIPGSATFYATKARAEELLASELAVSIVSSNDDATEANGEGEASDDTTITT